MIRSLRAFFLGRPLREKILLIAFTGIGMLIWASSYSDRARRFWRTKNATTAELKSQDLVLKNSTKIESAAQKAAAQLDPAQTLDGVRLYSAVQELARETGIKTLTNVTTPPDQTTGQFSIHSLSFTVVVGGSQQEWLTLEKFYAALRNKAPYIGIEQFQLGSRGAPPQQQHMLQLKVSAVEIVR
jgi:hypothetical protein